MVPVIEDNETFLHSVKYTHIYNQSLKLYIKELLVESTLGKKLQLETFICQNLDSCNSLWNNE